MSSAQQESVRDRCLAAVFPMFEVMDVGPGRWMLTAGPSTLSITGDDRFADRGRPRLRSPADVEGFAGRVHDTRLIEQSHRIRSRSRGSSTPPNSPSAIPGLPSTLRSRIT